MEILKMLIAHLWGLFIVYDLDILLWVFYELSQ